jgi:hypothetical protein
MNGFKRTLGFLLVIISGHALAQQPATQAVVRPALDGIFEAFKAHPLVGLGDDHGMVQGMEFYAALVRDPRFAREVGNVVVEFGAAGHQGIMDRYQAGERVPYTELRKVWTDTVGAIPTAGNMGFARFFAMVRKINKALPSDKRIRVWLGEPPIDWSVAVPPWSSALRLRDSHPADLIDQNILARGKKALVIYGAFHFTPQRDPAGGGTLYLRVEEKHPGAFFLAIPYAQSHHPAACAPFLKQAEKMWPTPALAAPPRKGTADAVMRDCGTFPNSNPTAEGPSSPPAIGSAPPPVAQPFDGVIFFGPLEGLTRIGTLPEYALDTEYRLEMGRRANAVGFPLLRWPKGWSFRKSDYEADLDSPGYSERLNAMFAKFDANNDGVVTEDEYEDPIPLPELVLSAAAFATLAGTWTGTEGTSNMSLVIEKDARGHLLGNYSNTDLNITVPVTEAELKGTRLVAKLGTVAAVLTLDLAGTTLAGTAVRPNSAEPVRVTLSRK